MTDVLRRLAALEPLLIRQAIGLTIAGLLIWGFDLTDVGGRLQATADVAGALIAVMTQLWARDHVTPAAAVIARVADPRDEPTDAVYLAGGYNVHRPGRRIDATSSVDALTGRSGFVELHRDAL